MVAVTTIRAAGGVVWRDAREVCLVHRPRYDDWSLPKGKLDDGEHPLVAAVREVWEEAGARAVPQVRLPSAHYQSFGRPKVVDFWSMRTLSIGAFTPNEEADEVRWLPPEAAAELVSYPHDRRVIEAFAVLPPVTSILALVRHGRAGRRDARPGPDAERPLDADGAAAARKLADLLTVLRPRRLVTATPLRCVQTLEPLAGALHAPVERDSAFDELGAEPEARVKAGVRAAERLVELAAAGESTVVCSQGKVIPHALAALARRPDPAPYHTAKGGAWLLAFAGRTLVGADRISPLP